MAIVQRRLATAGNPRLGRLLLDEAAVHVEDAKVKPAGGGWGRAAVARWREFVENMAAAWRSQIEIKQRENTGG